MLSTAPSFVIRAATPEDGAAINALLGELGYEISADGATVRLSQLASTGSDPVYLALRGAVPLGLIALHWTSMLHLEAPAARITALVVSEKARRQGVGQRLIDRAIETARTGGCGSIELTTATHRADAHAFYCAVGFTQTSVRFHLALR